MEERVSILKCIIIGNCYLFVSILASVLRRLYTEGKYIGTISSVCGSSLSVSYKSYLFFFLFREGLYAVLLGDLTLHIEVLNSNLDLMPAKFSRFVT